MQETQEITRTNAQQAGQTVRPDQPYVYPPRYEFREPDWKRWPAYANVTQEEWESALWQRQHSIKNLRELAQVWGPYADQEFLDDIQADIERHAMMSMLIPPPPNPPAPPMPACPN